MALKLTAGNFAQLQGGISIENFPKTFQDAVSVCRLLDIPFLWIDSLCIMQDSASDWDEQGSKMHAVYSNAFLVIAADAAPNSTTGFLKTAERQDLVIRVDLHLEDSIGQSGVGNSTSRVTPPNGHVYARQKGIGGLDVFYHHSRKRKYQSKLSVRGWVMQESILARRILHFTSEEVTWECKEISRCECQIAPHAIKTELPVRQQVQSPPDFRENWSNLVQDFTCRDLTYASDRLAAISGLASSAQPSAPDIAYYAGFWSDSLPHALFWRCIPHTRNISPTSKPSRRVSGAHAPTWSWASITGRVMLGYKNTTLESNMKEIQIKCIPAGKNRYGSVKGASLTVKAHVLRGKVFQNADGRADQEFQIRLSRMEKDDKDLFSPAGATFLDVIGDKKPEISHGDEVVLINQYDIGPSDWRGQSCLLLKETNVPGTYQRVGLFMHGHETQRDPSQGELQTVTIQ